jgi:hypothetical protein
MTAILLIGALLASASGAEPPKPCPAKPFSLAKPPQPAAAAEAPKKASPAPAKVTATPAKPKPGCKSKPA